MSTVAVLHVVDAESGERLGSIRLSGDTAAAAGSVAEGVWQQFRSRLDSDRETYDLLKSGWSNGYITVQPEGDSLK